jgi:hypothetical protein
MSLYFSAAVWASLALCVVYSLDGYLPHYRAETTAISSPSDGRVTTADGALELPRH